MTVTELIRDLQALPNPWARVEVVLSRVYVGQEDGTEGVRVVEMDDSDARAADEVVNLGPVVLIRSK